MYKFERYTGKYIRGDDKISIQKSGLVRLSAGFCNKTHAMDYNYSVLFYDSLKKAIAFQFTNLKEEGALRITKDRNAATISAKSFISAYHLNSKNNFHRYSWKKESVPGIGEVFIINL